PENAVATGTGRALLAYYVVLNLVFGVIGALGRAGRVSELSLQERPRAFLARSASTTIGDPGFAQSLIERPTLRLKSNFRSCLQDINESHPGREQLGVYRDIANPLVAETR